MDIKEIKHQIEQFREDLDLEVANYEAFQIMAQEWFCEQELRAELEA